MRGGEDVPQPRHLLSADELAAAELAGPVDPAPTGTAGFRAFLRRVAWHKVVLLVGLVVQPLALFAVSQSVDVGRAVLSLWFATLRTYLGLAGFF